MMTAIELRKVLKEQYGINTIEEFNEAEKKAKRIDLGMFVAPIKEAKVDTKEKR